MNAQKKDMYNKDICIHTMKYMGLVLLFAVLCQIFTNQVLIRYGVLLTANYDDLMVNLFTAQVTIIILPLSLFGIFTEISNEVYLGQSIAEYMYMYKGEHFFAFRYKELAINSMILTLVEYFLMSQGLLAAELAILVINTVAMLVSLFSWFEVRIRKEKLHKFIQEQLYAKIGECTGLGENDTSVLMKFFSKLKDWVVNGGDNELVEAMQFYEKLSYYINFWYAGIRIRNTEEKQPFHELLLSYENIDIYFDEMIAALLNKQDYYRALRCSKSMLEIIVWDKAKNYCPKHYLYHILSKLFRNMNEVEIDLLGDRWFCDYLDIILKNGNVKGASKLATWTEKIEDKEALHCIIEECYMLVYEFIMSVWQNNNLSLEYKQKQLNEFLLRSTLLDLYIKDSVLCVRMKLMETKEQTIIDMVVDRSWNELVSFIEYCCFTEKGEWECIEKSMVLLLAYSYYLTVYTEQNISIPRLKTYNVTFKIHGIEEHYAWEVLADCVWKCFDEIKEFLDRNRELDEKFRYKYDDVIYDIMLYSAMFNGQWSVLAENRIEGYNKVINFFKYMTGNDDLLEAAISRCKKFIDLFGPKGMITDEMINDRFYEFKKEILQYYMEPVKKASGGFDKEAFWENLKEKVREELAVDPQFEVRLSGVPDSEGIVCEAIYSWFYFILQYEGDYDAHKIKEYLCARLLREVADKEGTCNREITQLYDVLSLEWSDEVLNDNDIGLLVEGEKKSVVPLRFRPVDYKNIYEMNFRTYDEAYEFAKSAYRKIVFRMDVKIRYQEDEKMFDDCDSFDKQDDCACMGIQESEEAAGRVNLSENDLNAYQ